MKFIQPRHPSHYSNKQPIKITKPDRQKSDDRTLPPELAFGEAMGKDGSEVTEGEEEEGEEEEEERGVDEGVGKETVLVLGEEREEEALLPPPSWQTATVS